VPHHLVDFLDPHERYSAARFASDAVACIEALAARGKRAIVVGGTGFYVRALAGDVALSSAYDEGVRSRLARETRLHPPDVMHAWLAARSPERAAMLAPGDRYRVARALEVTLAADPGDVPEAGIRTLRSIGKRALKLVLEIPSASLERRIAERVDAMLAAGFLEEAERIGPAAVAANAVGYPQALAYLEGRSTAPELRAALVRATRRYAKRQATWFRYEPEARAVSAESVARIAQAELGW
jgi:tRNA dimethylallyltransferase